MKYSDLHVFPRAVVSQWLIKWRASSLLFTSLNVFLFRLWNKNKIPVLSGNILQIPASRVSQSTKQTQEHGFRSGIGGGLFAGIAFIRLNYINYIRTGRRERDRYCNGWHSRWSHFQANPSFSILGLIFSQTSLW